MNTTPKRTLLAATVLCFAFILTTIFWRSDSTTTGEPIPSPVTKVPTPKAETAAKQMPRAEEVMTQGVSGILRRLDPRDSSSLQLIEAPEYKYPRLIVEVGDEGIAAWAATQAIVSFEEVPNAETLSKLEEDGFALRDLIRKSTYLVTWESGNPLADFPERINALKMQHGVQQVQADHLYFAQVTSVAAPADPDAWLHRFQMDYIRANDLRADGILIAVLDTGINVAHEDLAGVIFVHPGEVQNGVDTDKNGFIDDVRGWDFVQNDNNPSDADGHGTGMAGAIAAIRNNDKGINGIASGARILNVRILNQYGSGFSSDIIKAIDYAASFSPQIMNCSWGGGSYNSAMRDAFADYISAGGVVVASAGNDGKSLEENFDHYPSGYDLPGIVSVGSLNSEMNLASFSNYGETEVDWLLPGEGLTVPGLQSDAYSLVSGTSVSTAIMSGILAHAKTKFPNQDWAYILEKVKLASSPLVNLPVNPRPVRNYGLITLSRLYEEAYISPPVIKISPSPKTHFIGESVTLSLSMVGKHAGDFSWYSQAPGSSEKTILSNSRQLKLIADEAASALDYYASFSSYYGETTCGPFRLQPQSRSLYVRSDFNDTYYCMEGSSLSIPAAFSSNESATVNWYAADGTYLATGDTYTINSFSALHPESIYWTAANSTKSIVSPPIHISKPPVSLREYPGVRDSGILVAGNGVYLHSGSILLVSRDAIYWRSLVSVLPEEFLSIEFFKGKFYAGSSDGLYQSTDGIHWQRSQAFLDYSRVSIRRENASLFVSARPTNEEESRSFRTYDGEIWHSAEGMPYKVGDFFFRIENYYQLYCSRDGENWFLTECDFGFNLSTNSLLGFYYCEGLYLISIDGRFYYSWNGIHWIRNYGTIRGDTPALVRRDNRFICGFYELDSFGFWQESRPFPPGTMSSLDDGRLAFSSSSSNLFIEDNGSSEEVRPWLTMNRVATPTKPGQPYRFTWDVSTEEIDSVEIFMAGSIIERRVDPSRFFDEVYFAGAGNISAQLVLNLKSGESHLSPEVNFSQTIATRPFPFQLSLSQTEFVLLGSGKNFRIVKQSSESFKKSSIVWMDPWGSSPEVVIGEPGEFERITFLRADSINEVLVIGKRGDGQYKLFKVAFDGSFEHVSTFTGGGIPVIEQIWGADLISYSTLNGDNKLSVFDGTSFSAVSNLPDRAVPFRSATGEWSWIVPIYPQTLQKVGNRLLMRGSGGNSLDLVSGTQWELPGQPGNVVRAEFGDSLVFGFLGKDFIISHPESGYAPFADVFSDILDYYDPDGDSIIWKKGYLSWSPMNELLLQGSSAPRMITGEAGLALEVPVTVRQLMVQPPDPKQVTFNIYYRPTGQFHVPLSSLGELAVECELARGPGETLFLQVPLTAMPAPGTYTVQISANESEMNFPEYDLVNNRLSLEWVRNQFASVTFPDDGAYGSISMSGVGSAPSVGDSATFTFSPKPGFQFTGWSESLGSSLNPVTRELPDYLEVRAGVLPSDLFSLFPDSVYTGVGTWHESDQFGTFASELYPWLLHEDHGWIHMEISSESPSFFYHDCRLGWIYSHRDVYPFIYQVAEGRWLHYLHGSSSPRWFYDLTSSEWLFSE